MDDGVDTGEFMKIKFALILLGVLVFFFIKTHSIADKPITANIFSSIDWEKELAVNDVPIYHYQIVRTYSHNENSFTEGLELHGNILYESSGLYKLSKLSKIDLQTERTTLSYDLSPNYFAEGITILGNKLYQLTYESNIGFIYNMDTFHLEKTFTYPMQGWGLTNNGKELIMSNGSASLVFLDPNNFAIKRYVIVHHNQVPITHINELEYIKGKIYANIQDTNLIAMISPEDGRILGWIDLRGLYLPPKESLSWQDLNGIAYDQSDDTLLVTGKLWPKLYKLKIIPKSTV